MQTPLSTYTLAHTHTVSLGLATSVPSLSGKLFGISGMRFIGYLPDPQPTVSKDSSRHIIYLGPVFPSMG